MLSLFLSFTGKSSYEILEILRPGLERCHKLGGGFSRREIEKTVTSACRNEYKYYHNPKGELFQNLLSELGNGSLQSEKIPIEHLIDIALKESIRIKNGQYRNKFYEH